MGRPRKPPAELTTEEALKRLFPKRVVTRAKKEVKKADSQTIKKDSR